MADDKTNENTDSQNGTEIADTESVGTDTESDAAPAETEVDVAKLQESNKRLFERAKKAETDLKAFKQGNSQAQTQKPAQQTSSSSTVDVDERVLKAQGMAPELLKQLKDIATLRSTTLLDAQSDPLFVAVKSQFEKDQKHKAASVGASRGSGAVKVQKTLSTPGLTREEHMALVKGS